MSRSHQLAWAAGFFDGDGYLSIQNRVTKYKDKVYNGMYVRIGVGQVSEVPLKELQRIFGGSIRIKTIGPNKDNYNRKGQSVWTLSTKAACEAIEQMLPYLIHKKEVALLALEFQKTMGDGKVCDDTLTYRALLKDRIQSLNSRD